MPPLRAGPPLWCAEIAGVKSPGIGYGPPFAAKRSIVEELERYWLTRAVRPNLLQAHEASPPSERTRAFLAERGCADVGAIASMPCLNLSSGGMEDVPAALVSLDPSVDGREYFRASDSSGAAAHVTLQSCLESCVLEFAERQSLIAQWRLGTPAFALDDDVIADAASARRLGALQAEGTVMLADISVLSDASVVLAAWFGTDRSRPDAMFAAGCAAGLDQATAAKKALRECSQALMNMRYNVRLRAVTSRWWDQIQEYYTAANDEITPGSWACFRDELAPRGRSGPDPTLSSLLDELRTMTNSLYFGWGRVTAGRLVAYAGHVVSPDFFVAMNDLSGIIPPALQERFGSVTSRNTPLPFG